MYIESFVNNGKPYLRIARSVRIAKPDGRKIPQKLYRPSLPLPPSNPAKVKHA